MISTHNHWIPESFQTRICRWHRHRKRGSVKVHSKLGLIALLFDSSLESDAYNHVFLSSISPREAKSDFIIPTSKTTIRRWDSTDYGPNSIYWSKWNLLGKVKVCRVISPIIVWTLRSWRCGPLVLGPLTPSLVRIRGCSSDDCFLKSLSDRFRPWCEISFGNRYLQNLTKLSFISCIFCKLFCLT